MSALKADNDRLHMMMSTSQSSRTLSMPHTAAPLSPHTSRSATDSLERSFSMDHSSLGESEARLHSSHHTPTHKNLNIYWFGLLLQFFCFCFVFVLFLFCFVFCFFFCFVLLFHGVMQSCIELYNNNQHFINLILLSCVIFCLMFMV